MNTFAHKPRPPLSDFIVWIWSYEGSRQSRELLLPIGTVELVINLTENPTRIFTTIDDLEGKSVGLSAVNGPQSKYFVLVPNERVSVIGVHFKPGGLRPFVRLPLADLADTHVALEDLWGRDANLLREQLLYTSRVDDRLALLERALMARLEGRPVYHPIVAYALNQFGSEPALARIDYVSKSSGYSAKRFIQIFNEGVGLTPKRYCRVRRFQSVISQLNRGMRVEWADVAADSGYYDQSHLIHDFREMAGITPAQYEAVDSSSPNHARI